MKCSEVIRKLDAYAEGNLGRADAAALKAHVSQCASCRERLDALEALGSRLTEVLQKAVDTPDIGESVMARLPGRAPTPVYRRAWGWAMAGACLAALVIAFCLLYKPPRPARPVVVRIERDSPKTPVHHPKPSVASNNPANRPVAHKPVERRVGKTAPAPRHVATKPKAPVHSNPAPRTARDENDSGRLETRVITLGGAYQVKQTVCVLSPNNDAATVSRPPLPVLRQVGPNISTISENGG